MQLHVYEYDITADHGLTFLSFNDIKQDINVMVISDNMFVDYPYHVTLFTTTTTPNKLIYTGDFEELVMFSTYATNNIMSFSAPLNT